jgi:D-beta-D-heptose 7-phosphate kinase/D-beta-D-heptose 1-phosphate adenosyltransferase
MLNSGINEIVGFTNGCFDVLHVGHLKLFQFIKENCDILIVGIDSDRRVKELKGNNRPVNCEKDRALMLESLVSVDRVYIFDSEDALTTLVKNINPDLMVVGADYKDKRVIGSEHTKKLIFFEKINGYSTTKIMESASGG